MPGFAMCDFMEMPSCYRNEKGWAARQALYFIAIQARHGNYCFSSRHFDNKVFKTGMALMKMRFFSQAWDAGTPGRR